VVRRNWSPVSGEIDREENVEIDGMAKSLTNPIQNLGGANRP